MNCKNENAKKCRRCQHRLLHEPQEYGGEYTYCPECDSVGHCEICGIVTVDWGDDGMRTFPDFCRQCRESKALVRLYVHNVIDDHNVELQDMGIIEAHRAIGRYYFHPDTMVHFTMKRSELTRTQFHFWVF